MPGASYPGGASPRRFLPQRLWCSCATGCSLWTSRSPGKPYTLRHLLQHRSGLANYGGFRAYHEAVDRGDDAWPVPELLDRLDADRLRYPAGEGWDYSNIGYLFVAQLIEATAGAELDEALQRLVLKPLGIEGARDRADKGGS